LLHRILKPTATEQEIFIGKVKGKDIPVTGRGDPWGCERSRLPHYLDKRLTDGGNQPCAPASLYPQVSLLRFLREREIFKQGFGMNISGIAKEECKDVPVLN
jgi:hypothetical protein